MTRDVQAHESLASDAGGGLDLAEMSRRAMARVQALIDANAVRAAAQVAKGFDDSRKAMDERFAKVQSEFDSRASARYAL